MKKLIVIAALLFGSPVFAQTAPVVSKPKVYRPFVYETNCILEYEGQTYEDLCKVVETRETGGSLKTRNIYSNKFGLTIKGRFDKQKGYMTWDSHNKFEYKFNYKVGGTGWTYVMPGVLLENISWD